MTSLKENVKKVSPVYEPKKHPLMFTVLGYERFLYFQFLTMGLELTLVLLIFLPYIPSPSSKGKMSPADFYEEFLCRVKKYNQNNNPPTPHQFIPFPSGWHTGLVLLYWKNHRLSVDVSFLSEPGNAQFGVSSWSLCRVLQTQALWGAGLCRDRVSLVICFPSSQSCVTWLQDVFIEPKPASLNSTLVFGVKSLVLCLSVQTLLGSVLEVTV